MIYFAAISKRMPERSNSLDCKSVDEDTCQILDVSLNALYDVNQFSLMSHIKYVDIGLVLDSRWEGNNDPIPNY